MHLIWHIARKDAIRLRLHFLVWLASTLLAGSSLGWYRRFPDFSLMGAEPWLIVQALIFILSGFFAYNFFVELALGDSPSDRYAFWRTRPISGWRLLASKILVAQFAATATALGFVATRIGTDLNGFSSAAIAFGTTLLLSEVIALAAFACACIVRTSRQCLLLSLGWYVLHMIMMIIAQAGRMSGDPHWQSFQLSYARSVVIPILAFGTAIAVIFHQYSTLQRARSAVLLGVGTLGIFAAELAWPFSWPHPTLTEERAAEAYRSVKLGFDHATQAQDVRSFPLGIDLVCRVEGLADNESAVPAVSLHQWTDLSSGMMATSWMPAGKTTPGVPEEIALEILGFAKTKPGAHQVMFAGALPTAATARAWRTRQPLGYRAEIPLEIWKTSAALRVPFQQQEHETADGKLSVAKIERKAFELDVQLLVFRDEKASGHLDEPTVRRSFLAINRRTNSYRTPMNTSTATVAFSNIVRVGLRFVLKAEDEDFWQDAELVQVTSRRVAVIRRTVEVPQFLAKKEEPKKQN